MTTFNAVEKSFEKVRKRIEELSETFALAAQHSSPAAAGRQLRNFSETVLDKLCKLEAEVKV